MRNKVAESGPVKAGTLLLSERPFAFVLTSQEKGQRCDFCLEKGKVLKCSGCHYVHYCGRVCQRDAWNVHKWECDNIKRISPKVLPDAARLLARIISRVSKGDGNSFRSFYTSQSFRMWKDLMSHYSDIKNDRKRMDHFSTLCAVLSEFFKDTSLPNTVELMGMYGRMCINSFTLLDTDMNSIGTAIYLGASIVDHSCRPNAVATFDGTTISIRATKDMSTLDWDQIRISYIDVMKTAYERQKDLLESYYFLCQCQGCLDEHQMKLMYGAKCPNSQCDNPVQIPWKKDIQLVIRSTNGNTESTANGKVNDLNSEKQSNGYSTNEDKVNSENDDFEESNIIHCSECGAKVSEKRAEDFKKAMEFTELHVQNMKNASNSFVDVCRHCLSRQDGLVHPLNVLRAQTLDHALDAHIQTEKWDQACALADTLLPCFMNYYGDRHPLTGLLHLKYGKILLFTMRTREAVEQLKCAQKILRITHGDRHPLYRRELMMLLEQAVMESC